MPKVHKVKARIDAPKACPKAKAGETYWWWKNRMKGMKEGVVRCTVGSPPKRSQTIVSDYSSAVVAISEDMDDSSFEDVTDFEAARDEWVEQIKGIADEQDEKLNNMPEQFQESDTGQLLQERKDALESWAAEIEGVTVDEPDRDDYEEGEEGDEEYQDALNEAIQEAINECSGGCPE